MSARQEPITSSFTHGNNFEMEYQENMMSQRCKLMYDKWRRTETEKCFNNVSKDGKFVIGLIGKDGGYLELKNRRIQLFIPPGAIEIDGDGEYVFVYADTVQCNLVYYDVIICGPPGLKFSNSVVLRFPKSKPRHEERVLQHRSTNIMLSVQKLGEPMLWRSLDTSEDGFCFLDDIDVFLHLNHFTGIKPNHEVISTPSTDDPTEDARSRSIYISAFLERCDNRNLSLRVFCSTYSALMHVTKEESENSSRKVGNPVKIGSYQSRDEVKIKIVECVDCRVEPSDYTICVGDVVSDVGYVFRQFVLERPKEPTNEAYLKFQVNVCDRIVHFAHVNAGRSLIKSQAAVDKLYKADGSSRELVFTPSPLARPILSMEVRRELSIQLDVLRVSQMQGDKELMFCDYRGLAKLMGMSESFIDWLGAPKNFPSSTSPTITLLDTWEVLCREKQLTNHGAMKELEWLFKKLNHSKCINIVTECMRIVTKPKERKFHIHPRQRSMPSTIYL
ncbi:uncharacterized protein LOC117102218 [Anneissia japonica]|uniref:uncharacterized protein LOC117102218 n=1 Tax=Anneissia japonica TaxID=1529436 RepID=UPI0014259504|nr:uncharacterized protein LOC117102218 [Anneissia japonica]